MGISEGGEAFSRHEDDTKMERLSEHLRDDPAWQARQKQIREALAGMCQQASPPVDYLSPEYYAELKRLASRGDEAMTIKSIIVKFQCVHCGAEYCDYDPSIRGFEESSSGDYEVDVVCGGCERWSRYCSVPGGWKLIDKEPEVQS